MSFPLSESPATIDANGSALEVWGLTLAEAESALRAAIRESVGEGAVPARMKSIMESHVIAAGTRGQISPAEADGLPIPLFNAIAERVANLTATEEEWTAVSTRVASEMMAGLASSPSRLQ